MIKSTSFIDEHRRLSAKFINFHGWKLPLEFAGIGATKEHLNVRENVGIFDVSHMGKIHVTGAGALRTLERLLTNNVGNLEQHQVQYNLLCNHDGGVLDDLLLYCLNQGKIIY